jgi:hypothetical protein
MKERVNSRVRALIKRAEEGGSKVKSSPTSRNRSSLHKIIKTKEQADAFMKLLRSA